MILINTHYYIYSKLLVQLLFVLHISLRECKPLFGSIIWTQHGGYATQCVIYDI